jgi:hypothetical protein
LNDVSCETLSEAYPGGAPIAPKTLVDAAARPATGQVERAIERDFSIAIEVFDLG